jgi:hypothetical protein
MLEIYPPLGKISANVISGKLLKSSTRKRKKNSKKRNKETEQKGEIQVKRVTIYKSNKNIRTEVAWGVSTNVAREGGNIIFKG